MYKILLLEDDKLLSETIQDILEDENYVIDIAYDGEEALELNYKNNYDLYLLDINVPKINGLDLLQSLRNTGDDTPTIFLTSYKDKQTLKEGFANGADDYITKPFDMDELILRIQALLKRSGKVFENIILNEALVFNPTEKRVFENNKDINLPHKVITLLELCLENKDKIISKEMIINKLWSTEESYSEGSIRVYVNALKKLLGKEKITNIKGIGYKVEL